MKKLTLFIILTVCFANVTLAQSHNMDVNYNCLLKKGNRLDIEKHPCPACEAKDKKEREVKKAEDKRRADAVITANNVKQAELKRVADLKKAEEKKNAHSGELLINGNTNIGKSKVVVKTTPPKKAQITTDDVIFAKGEHHRHIYGYKTAPFFNEKDEMIVENSDWSATFTVRDISFAENTPKNFGIARIGKLNSHWSENSYNIVDRTGNYLLDDTNITSIYHLNNNWFLISSRPNNYYLLNMQTQKKIPLPFFGKKANFAYQNFPPSFSDKVTMNTSWTYINERMVSESKLVKKLMMKNFPAKVNENVLGKYSFVLFQTDYYETLSVITNENFNRASRIEMYGIKENGEMETIRIK